MFFLPLSQSKQWTERIPQLKLEYCKINKNSQTTREERREENQLDATECFIALINCPKCFGHLYAHN